MTHFPISRSIRFWFLVMDVMLVTFGRNSQPFMLAVRHARKTMLRGAR